MVKSPKALINVKILKWVRADLEINSKKMAKLANCSVEKYKAVERGEKYFTMNQLRELAKRLRINMTLFYFKKIPNISLKQYLGEDFRCFGENISFETISEIFKILEQRAYFIELINENPDYSWRNIISNSDSYEKTGKKIRKLLGITVDEQLSWKSNVDAFNNWRDAIEKLGILVFKVGKISVNQFRGYSFSRFPFPIIIINNKDAIHAQIFTLMHELVHIFKENTCFSNPYSISPENMDSNIDREQLEIFANYVAGEILIPREHISKNSLVASKGKKASWSINEIKKLSKLYHVSDEVIFRRLLILEYATLEEYRKYREELQKSIYRQKKKSKGGNYYNIKKSFISPYLRKSTFESFRKSLISELECAKILNIKRDQIYNLMNDL
ncbi:MAG: ImmA/IrrE family metallo-endopeptidase [Promethearchaeota archaeon]